MFPNKLCFVPSAIQWRHNEHDDVWNHWRFDCLLDHLFRRRSKKTPKFPVTALFRGIHQPPVDSPHKGPVRRKLFPLMAPPMVDCGMWNGDELNRPKNISKFQFSCKRRSHRAGVIFPNLASTVLFDIFRINAATSMLSAYDIGAFVFRMVFYDEINSNFYILNSISIHLIATNHSVFCGLSCIIVDLCQRICLELLWHYEWSF